MQWLRRLPVVVVAMSLPLLFSNQLKRPPTFLNGLPFAAIWTWGVVATVVLPMLLIGEGATCVWLLGRRSGECSTLSRHVGALLLAIAAEIVFILMFFG
jgi:hypothetical protein